MPLVTAQQPLPAAAPTSTPQEPQQEQKKDERLSSNFAALAKQTKALRAAQEKFKKEREDWQSSRKAEEEKYTSKDFISRERLLKEPTNVLQELGISQDQFANMALALPNEQQAAFNKLLARIDELEGRYKGVEEQFTQRDKQYYDQAVNQIKNEVKILVDSDAEYELIKETGSIDDVVKRIEETFEKQGIMLSVDEAAKQIEKELIEDAIKIAGLKKVKEKLSPAQIQQQQTNQQQQPIRTLTQDLSASASKPTLSAKIRRDRAIMRAQGLDPDTGKPITG